MGKPSNTNPMRALDVCVRGILGGVWCVGAAVLLLGGGISAYAQTQATTLPLLLNVRPPE